MTGLACATCVAVRFQKQLSNCPTTKHPGSPKPRQHVVLVGLPSPKMLPSSLGDQAKLPKCNAPQSGEITGDLQVRSNELLLRSIFKANHFAFSEWRWTAWSHNFPISTAEAGMASRRRDILRLTSPWHRDIGKCNR